MSPNVGGNASAARMEEYPSRLYGWHVFFVLTLAYVFSFLDRQILSLLVEPMKRDLHFSDTQVSLLQGLASFVVFGTSGMICGGLLRNWVARNGDRSARLRLAGLVSLLTVPLALSYPLVGNPRVALALLAGATFLQTFLNGMAPAIVQQMVPNQMRGIAVAGTLLVVNLLYLGLGPTLIALVTDFVFGDPNKLNLSIALVSAVMLGAGLVMLLLALKPYRNTVNRLESWKSTDYAALPDLR